MRDPYILLITCLAFSLSACKDDGDKLGPATALLVNPLNAELSPLPQDPIQWADDQLSFLDAYANKDIVGLGEATHGTSEFFKAKHRILRYLVEKHGFRIFAIEADLGESTIINDAVMKGDKSQIVSIMKEKMLFWSWRTNEVRDMLFWMCDYNIGKEASEKVQYWGMDCQYNTYNPRIVIDKLTKAGVPFMSFAKEILDNATAWSNKLYDGVSSDDLEIHFKKLGQVTDSVTKYHNYIVSKTSEEDYAVTLHFMEIVQQTAEVGFDIAKDIGTHPRDKYMAANTMWLREHFNKKVVVWAHDLHIENLPAVGSAQATMGSYITDVYGDDYVKIGQMFSKGTFRARPIVDGVVKPMEMESLTDDPLTGTLNYIMSHASEPVFTVGVGQLLRDEAWQKSVLAISPMQYFWIGSTYNKVSPKGFYYKAFSSALYDRIIYFNETSAAVEVSD